MVGITNYAIEEVLEGIKKAEADRSYYLAPGFVDKDKLPQWADFMNAVYYMASQDKDEVLESHLNKERESLVGNLIIQKGIYFNFKASREDNAKLFPQIQEIINGLPLAFYGPKISMGPYFVEPHPDRWHGATLQCEGDATWSFKDGQHITENISKFDLNDPLVHRITMKPGDFLYFSQKLWHQIEVDGPRASMLFNSNGIVDRMSE